MRTDASGDLNAGPWIPYGAYHLALHRSMQHRPNTSLHPAPAELKEGGVTMWRGEGGKGRLDASRASASCMQHPEASEGGCHAVGGGGGGGAAGRVDVTGGDMQRFLWQDVVLSCNVGADWVTCPSSVYTGSKLRVLHTSETLRTHCGKAAYNA